MRIHTHQPQHHSYVKWPAPVGLRPRAATPWRALDLCKAYNFPTSAPGGGVIGIVELAGGWTQSDLDQFSKLNGLPPIVVEDVSADGTSNHSNPDPNADGEVALDIQVAASAYYYATGTMGYLIVVNGQEVQIGGTSAVAPLYAGLFAAFGNQLGFVTPTLYQHPEAFYDITQGSNGGFSASVGPDPCTGMGSPNGAVLANLFTGGGVSAAAGAPHCASYTKYPSTSPPTLAELDEHFKHVDLAQFAPGGAHVAAAGIAPAAALGNICPAYKMIRPLLLFLVGLPLIPQNWKAAIQAFVKIMDIVCP